MRSKVKQFLSEDIGSGDITSRLVIPRDANAIGRIICKEQCVLAGSDEAGEVFKRVGAKSVSHKKDGSRTRKGEVVLLAKGNARALLAGERLALNMLMRMSGIATLTNQLVERCRKINPKVRIAATRKTTPGFREYEKKAVALGGGYPHRSGLYDAILIKNNHIRIAGGVRKALEKAREGSKGRPIEIEVETIAQAIVAAEEGAHIIMLDNFHPAMARKAAATLREIRPSLVVEISGGITPENITKYAKSADIISLGMLTHSVKAIDFSMRIEKT